MCEWSLRQEFTKQRTFSYFTFTECISFSIWAVCISWDLEDKALTNWVPAARHEICNWQNTILPQCQLWKFFEMPLSLVLKLLITPYPSPVNAFPWLTDISIWNIFLESDMKNSGAGHEYLSWNFLVGVEGNSGNRIQWLGHERTLRVCNSANGLSNHHL